MPQFKPGDRVSISTVTRGCYHGRKGTVQSVTTDDITLKDASGYRYGLTLPAGWVDVKFDRPVDIGCGHNVDHDVFMPSELTLIQGG